MKRFLWLSLILGALFFLGGGLYCLNLENSKLARENQDLRKQLDKREVALFFIKSTPTNFFLQPVLKELSGIGDPHRLALEALLAGPSPGSGLQGIFPKGSRILRLTIAKGVATVDLNRKTTELNVGAWGEALAVAALTNTLTKFPDVYQVKILVEGEEVESLAGHVDLTQTFGFDNQAISLKNFK